MRIRWTAGLIPAPLVIRSSAGTREEAEPGMESRCKRKESQGWKNPPCMRRGVMRRREMKWRGPRLSKKIAIVCETHAVNRHDG